MQPKEHEQTSKAAMIIERKLAIAHAPPTGSAATTTPATIAAAAAEDLLRGKTQLHGMLAVAAEQARNKDEHAKELRKCEPLLDILHTVTAAADILLHCTSTLQRGEHTGPKIMVLFRELWAALARLPGPKTELGSGKVCHLLRVEAERVTKLHHQLLQSALETSVFVEIANEDDNGDGASLSICKLTLQTSALSAIWAALSQTTCAFGPSRSSHFQSIASCVSSLWLQVMQPLWFARPPCSAGVAPDGPIVSAIGSSHDDIRGVFFTFAQSSGDSASVPENGMACHADFSSFLGAVADLLQLLFATLFPGDIPVECVSSAAAPAHVISASASAGESVSSAAWKVLTKLLFNRLRGTLIASLPKDEVGLATFCQQSTRACEDFDQRCESLCPLPPSPLSNGSGGSGGSGGSEETQQDPSARSPQLSALLSSAPELFRTWCHRSVLGVARDILVSCDYDCSDSSTVAVPETADADSGYDPITDCKSGVGERIASLPVDLVAVLSSSDTTASACASEFESCRISTHARRLVQLIYGIMEVASNVLQNTSETGSENANTCTSDNSSASLPIMTASAYIESAVACLELYVSVVPQKYMHALETSFATAAVFYSDCSYFVHHCSLLSKVYKSLLINCTANDTIASKKLAFLEMIPTFSHLGKERLALHLKRQLSNVFKLAQNVNLSPNHSSGGRNRGQAPASSIAIDCREDSGSNYNSQDSDSCSDGSDSEEVEEQPRAAPSFGIFRVVGAIADTVAPKPKTVKEKKKKRKNHTDLGVSSSAASSSGGGGFADVAKGLAHGLGLDKDDDDDDVGGGRDSSYMNSCTHAKELMLFVNRLSEAWRSILAESVHHTLLGHVVESIVCSNVELMVAADTIDMQCGTDIQAVFCLYRDHFPLLFSANNFASSNNNVSANSSSISYGIELHVKSWRRMVAMNTFLECSLTEIAELLPLRTFSTFTVSEMVSLVMAVFEETSKRRAVLESISTMA